MPSDKGPSVVLCSYFYVLLFTYLQFFPFGLLFCSWDFATTVCASLSLMKYNVCIHLFFFLLLVLGVSVPFALILFSRLPFLVRLLTKFPSSLSFHLCHTHCIFVQNWHNICIIEFIHVVRNFNKNKIYMN